MRATCMVETRGGSGAAPRLPEVQAESATEKPKQRNDAKKSVVCLMEDQGWPGAPTQAEHKTAEASRRVLGFSGRRMEKRWRWTSSSSEDEDESWFLSEMPGWRRPGAGADCRGRAGDRGHPQGLPWRAEGIRSAWAADGRAALEMHLAPKPDLVLLDVRMPYVDGWQVLSEVRARGRRR